MLLAPSVAAVYVWAARPAAGDVNSDVLSSYYSFFMVVWGFVFLAFWQREANGLAMSSRNGYLSVDEKERGAALYQCLCSAKERI